MTCKWGEKKNMTVLLAVGLVLLIDPHRKQIAFAEHQPHKRVKQRRQSRRDVAVKQEHEKIELFIDFIDVFAVFRRAQIADASGKRGIHLAEQIIQAFQHKPIVGIYAHLKSYHN